MAVAADLQAATIGGSNYYFKTVSRTLVVLIVLIFRLIKFTS